MSQPRIDKGSLTPIEYEEIYAVLNDHCLNAKADYRPPTYTLEVRQAKAGRILKLMEKMKYRMEVKYPNSFVC